MSATLLRTTAARSLPRSFSGVHSSAQRSFLTQNAFRTTLSTFNRPNNGPRMLALALRRSPVKALVRYQSSRGLFDIKAAELELQNQKLEPIPEVVSTESSIHNVSSETATPAQQEDVDMMGGIRSDFHTIKDTFSLADVPKEALYVGLAGVIPYLATSLSTVYLAFDIQYAAVHGEGILMSGELAEKLLHVIEPIQLGYGASIISFLGAIHWGLEWAGYGGYQGYPRYSIGIIATAVAWPTLLLPAEVGLIAQFLAFTFLYYTDARASVRGWAPSWYATYRFVLTFVVGASIVASLIGRGQIADLITKPPGPADRMRALREAQMEQLEKEPIGGEEAEEAEEEE